MGFGVGPEVIGADAAEKWVVNYLHEPDQANHKQRRGDVG